MCRLEGKLAIASWRAGVPRSIYLFGRGARCNKRLVRSFAVIRSCWQSLSDQVGQRPLNGRVVCFGCARHLLSHTGPFFLILVVASRSFSDDDHSHRPTRRSFFFILARWFADLFTMYKRRKSTLDPKTPKMSSVDLPEENYSPDYAYVEKPRRTSFLQRFLPVRRSTTPSIEPSKYHRGYESECQPSTARSRTVSVPVKTTVKGTLCCRAYTIYYNVNCMPKLRDPFDRIPRSKVVLACQFWKEELWE